MVGEEFGSYKIVRKLGEGGMGEVYLARHVFMDRPAAIKVLLPELSSNKDVVGRFFAEARATDLIKHPNIVQIFDCAIHQASGRGYLVMEFLDGESLGARLGRAGTLDAAEVVDIAHDTASALQAAHDAGIVHRDLKPDNIFLSKADAAQRGSGRPVVKVLDFGIAKLAYPGSVSKTATGSILGTPLYMSPEQGRGLAKVDFRSDIYSLGCIIFEMVCGRPPFLREAPGDLIIAHATEPPPRMSTLVDGVSEDLEHLVARLLEKAPDARPQSMSEVVAALRPIQRGISKLDAASGVPSSRDEAPFGPLESGAPPGEMRDAAPLAVAPDGEQDGLSPRGGGTLRLPPDGSAPAPSIGGTKLLPPEYVERGGRPPSGPRRPPNTTLSSTASQSIPVASPRGTDRRSLSTALGLVIAAGLGVGGTYLWAARSRSDGTAAPRPAVVEERSTERAPTVPPPAVVPKVTQAVTPPPATAPVAPAASAAPNPTVAVPSDERGSEQRKRRSRPRRDQEPAPPVAPSQAAEVGSSFEQARSAYAHADYISSLRLAKRAVREGVGIPAYILVGQSYERLERLDEAADAYRGALAIDPSDTIASKLLRHIEKTK